LCKKRIGPDPHKGGSDTPALGGCPDIWELENGDFAVIGLNNKKTLLPFLPKGATCGDDEGIVVLPRRTLINAKNCIPKK